MRDIHPKSAGEGVPGIRVSFLIREMQKIFHDASKFIQTGNMAPFAYFNAKVAKIKQ